MRFAGAVVRNRHQRVELAAQVAQLAMHRCRSPRRCWLGGPFLKLSPFPQLLVLAAVQQGAHLLGIEQPGDAR